jgi:hypothetical protein
MEKEKKISKYKNCFASDTKKSGGRSCKALRAKEYPSDKVCEKCKFFKTEKQFLEDVTLSEEMLKRKGLEQYTYTDEDGVKRMFVKKVKEYRKWISS